MLRRAVGSGLARDPDDRAQDGAAFSLDARPAIAGGLLVILLVVVGFAGWAATAPLASAVIASGVVVVEGKRKQVQHLEGGVVQKILVEDGSLVEAGQLLVRLDETRARATLGVLQVALDSALVLEARLTAERDGATALTVPQDLLARRREPSVADMIRVQETLFEARRESQLGQQDILRQRMASQQQEILGLSAQQKSLEKQIAFVEEELTALRELLEKGIAPKPKVLALEREAARLEGTRGERISDIARTQVAIGATRLELVQQQRTFRESVVKEQRDVRMQITDLGERITAAKNTLDNIEIRSPVAGTVVGLNAHTVGGVIKPGDVILDIVPPARLVVDAQILPTDIDNVAVGMDTELRLSAFKQRTAPSLNGRVVYASADRLTDQRSGQPYYLARAEIVEDEAWTKTRHLIQPGMPADVMIKKRERTALNYLLQPIADAMRQAWRED